MSADQSTASLVKAIKKATSLDALCAALNAFDLAVPADEDESLYDHFLTHRIDIASLPAYGGDGPADPTGVWSWDVARLLEQDENAPIGARWVINPREEDVA